MALKVIGSGLGRTGTKSLQLALNILGLGPCHHMQEVFPQPHTMPLWIEAGAGRPDWDAIFAGYQSMTDYPGSPYWRELAAYYPDAKLLHSERDPDEWFDSTQATIFAPDSGVVQDINSGVGVRAAFFKSFLGPYLGRFHDRAYMTDLFRRHNAEVKAAIPTERLLVYAVDQGWAPLCAFLGVPVPDEPFPAVNTREQFAAAVSRARATGPAAAPN